jgi:hypothetical protein
MVAFRPLLFYPRAIDLIYFSNALDVISFSVCITLESSLSTAIDSGSVDLPVSNSQVSGESSACRQNRDCLKTQTKYAIRQMSFS